MISFARRTLLLASITIITANASIFKSDGDPCDYLKWRTCQTSSDCEWDSWKHRTYDTSSTTSGSVAMWESEQTYGNFASYNCARPAEEFDMTNCNVLRCIPNLIAAFACQIDKDCADGQVCNAEQQCVACGNGNGHDATYFSEGACTQSYTPGSDDGVPQFDEGESGCAGDHCLHSCAYDTQCVRILNDTTTVDVTAPHNQLFKVLTLTEEDRLKLMRPSTCGGNDAGKDGGGMRCARMIHRTITSKERTPNEVRDRRLDVVELAVMKNGGDQVYENFFMVDEDDIANRAMKITQEGGRGYSIGYVIPDEGGARTEEGTTIGTGAFAHQPHGRVPHDWERRGLVQCEVKYTNDAPLHRIEDGETRSTLLTRACARYEDTESGEANPLHYWEPLDLHFSDNGMSCGPWGTTSFAWLGYIAAKCSLSGPSVKGIIPTEQERAGIKSGFQAAFSSGAITIHDVLRASFHDAAAYTPDPSGLFGGARGCMRFEHVHGNAPNIGLAFLIEPPLAAAVGCPPGVDGDNCFSMADILQFAGGVAVEYANGPSLAGSIKWGRVDAPRMFCPGELQTNMPDASGGHKEGSNIFGSSNVQARLQTVFYQTKRYFEEQLELEPEDWIAYLSGGHSIGGVKGLIQAKNTRHNFDATPAIMDDLYLHRVDRASQTSLMSLCPQAQKLGPSWFWEPSARELYADNANVMNVLIDTDVSLTTDDETMHIVRTFAHNQDLFFEHFGNAYLHVGELGYDDSLVSFGESMSTGAPSLDTSTPPSATKSPSPTDESTSSPTTSSPTDFPTSRSTSTFPPVDTHEAHKDIGYCLSDVDELVSSSLSTADECLSVCKLEYPLWTDLYIEFINGECYCQNDCPCLDDIESAGRITMVPVGFTLPESCCENDSNWRYIHHKNLKEKSCNWIAKNPTRWRCKRIGKDGTSANDACPAACNRDCV